MTSQGKNRDAPHRIAVVGGGITGLAAAHRIHELLPDARLTVFESSSRLGGVLETRVSGGFLVERSADSFLTRLPHATNLCRRIGIENDLISTDESRRRAFVAKGSRLIPIPEGFFLMSPRKLGPLLKSPLLSLPAKLRVLLEPFMLPGPAARTLEPDRRAKADESVASFVGRRFGREVFERLVQPLVAGIYTADPEQLSMAATMPEFLAQEREHGSLLRAAHTHSNLQVNADAASGARYSLFAAPKNGTAQLVDALAKSLPDGTVHLGTGVTQLHQTQLRTWRLKLAPNPQSAIHKPHDEFDALILAIPAHAAAELLQRFDSELTAALASIDYAGCAVVSLGFQRDQIKHPLDGFGFVVPRIEGRNIIAGSFASNKFPGRAPSDAVLIRVFIGGALQPQLIERDDEELRRIALQELRELLSIAGEPLLTDIARWPRSMPQYHVGHLSRAAQIDRIVARYPRLALAGNAYRGVGIPQCIASGERAAEKIATDIKP